MNRGQIAAQLYTVRDRITDSASAADALARIQKMGYNAVQVSGIESVSDDELVRMLDGEGLACCATHEPPEVILRCPHRVADRLDKLNCRFTAYPFPVGWELDSERTVAALARALDRAGEALSRSGKVLTYHNHAFEFQRIDGTTVFERLFSSTSPQHLQSELDTYWVQAGGCSPAAWLKAMKNRVPLLHLKDYAVNREAKPVFAEVGSGNFDWKEIISAADGSGCVWYIIEQDANWVGNDPFKSLEKSLRFVEENLCSSACLDTPKTALGTGSVECRVRSEEKTPRLAL